MVAGHALDAETAADIDGLPPWIAPTGHDETENLNASLLEANEGQSQPVRVCLASPNA